MEYLNRDQILAAQDLPVEEVEVPEWGGKVRLRTLGALDRVAFEEAAKGIRQTEGIRADALVMGLFICRCAVDEAGARIFQDADAEALAAKSGPVVMRLFGRAGALNGLTARDVEELAKN